MKQNTLLEAVKVAAINLKEGKLKKLEEIQSELEFIAKELEMKNVKEAMVFVVVFDCCCDQKDTKISDLANYFNCSSLEVMEYKRYFDSLMDLGLLDYSGDNQFFKDRPSYTIRETIFLDIINEQPIRKQENSRKSFSNFDFINVSHKLIDIRIITKKFLIILANLEAKYEHLSMIQEIKSLVPEQDIESRAIFYEICSNAINDFNYISSHIVSTLQDIFDQRETCIKHRAALLNNSHILITSGLVEIIDSDEMTLSNHSMTLLFGDYADSVREPMQVKNRYEFVKLVRETVNNINLFSNSNNSYSARHGVKKIKELETKNPHITFIGTLQTLISDFNNRLVFYMLAISLIERNNFWIRDLENLFTDRTRMSITRDFKENNMLVQKQNLVEVSNNSMFDKAELVLTEKGKELFLEEDFDLFEEKVQDKDLIKYTDIVPKRLFFDNDLQRQLQSVSNSLDEANYHQMIARLQEKNLPTGVAVLLYGNPGTGKTESVMQLAQKTGRDIVHVDISATKTCWFGESEKLIKGVFERYKRLCKKSKTKPILFFNEADAVFSKRKDSNSSNVAQTENAIQNIILEEMEKLDGILIATTNLVDNLDRAFERRFLFKIRFNQPTIEAKQSIWLDKMPSLSTEDATRLASQFDFSGGEIDNIIRKATMDEITTGVVPSYDSLVIICKEEKIGKQNSKIGFN